MVSSWPESPGRFPYACFAERGRAGRGKRACSLSSHACLEGNRLDLCVCGCVSVSACVCLEGNRLDVCVCVPVAASVHVFVCVSESVSVRVLACLFSLYKAAHGH